jgi:hypothetical protein
MAHALIYSPGFLPRIRTDAEATGDPYVDFPGITVNPLGTGTSAGDITTFDYASLGTFPTLPLVVSPDIPNTLPASVTLFRVSAGDSAVLTGTHDITFTGLEFKATKYFPFGFDPSNRGALTTLNRLWDATGNPLFSRSVIANRSLTEA